MTTTQRARKMCAVQRYDEDLHAGIRDGIVCAYRHRTEHRTLDAEHATAAMMRLAPGTAAYSLGYLDGYRRVQERLS